MIHDPLEDPPPRPKQLSPVEAAVSRLDPWSFTRLPGRQWKVDMVIAGTTGAFVVAHTTDLEGALAARRREVRPLREAAKRARYAFSEAGVHLDVHAVLSADAPFAPRQVKDIHVVPTSLLTAFVADRKRQLLPHQVERAATVLRRALHS
jgi:hypothetical protein